MCSESLSLVLAVSRSQLPMVRPADLRSICSPVSSQHHQWSKYFSNCPDITVDSAFKQKQTLKLEYWLLIFDMDCCLQSIWNVDNKSGESVVRTSSSPVVGGIPICKRSELIFVWLSLNIVDIIQSRHVSVSIILDYIFTSSSQADIEHKHITQQHCHNPSPSPSL